MSFLSLNKQQDIYRKVLVQEFIREFQFLADVLSGRAKAKGDFTDKILGALCLGLTTAMDNSGIPGASLLDLAINSIVDAANDKRKEAKFENIGSLYDEVDPEELRILIERVAFLAARQYQSAMSTKLSENPAEAIIPFAKTGVERMLEYIARKHLPLNEANLLQGLIEGRSGGYISGFTNTELKGKAPKIKGKDPEPEKNMTAEGLYGRSGFRDEKTVECFVLTKKEANQKQHVKLSVSELKTRFEDIEKNITQALQTNGKLIGFKNAIVGWGKGIKGLTEEQLSRINESFHDYGYTHFSDLRNTVSKYGYADVPHAIIERYKYKPQPPVNPVPASPYKIVSKNDVSDYLNELRTNTQTTGQPTPLSFNAFIAKRYPGSEIAVCSEDLTSLNDLSGGDFSDCDFSGSKLPENLKGTNFSGSVLINVDMQGVDASNAKFNQAQLQYLQAEGANFTGAEFTQAELQYAKLRGATLTGIQSLGAIWIGTELTATKNATTVQDTKAKQQKRYEEEKVRLMEQRLKVVETKVAIQSQVISTLSEKLETEVTTLDKEVKEQAIKMTGFLNDLAHQARLNETFKRYCEDELKALEVNTQQWQLLGERASAKQAENFKHMSQQINELTGQVETIEKVQKTISERQLEVQNIIEVIKEQSSLEQDVFKEQCEVLQKQITENAAMQATVINQLQTKLEEVQGNLEKAIENLQQALKEQGLTIADIQKRLEKIEAELMQQASEWKQPREGYSPAYFTPGIYSRRNKAKVMHTISAVEEGQGGVVVAEDNESDYMFTGNMSPDAFVKAGGFTGLKGLGK